MSGKPFLDTNVVAYALTNDARKKAIAEKLLADRPCISVQVVNELVNICVRKLGYSRETAIAAGRMVMRLCDVSPLDSNDVEQAFQLCGRFGYSHWDALILAAAFRQGCDVVYPEDMQHGQEIDGCRTHRESICPMTLDDPIPISALNQYAYCPRRCFLIHAEGEFEDNVHTLRGTHEHERVDGLKHEVSAGVRVEYALPVWSRRLGLSGRCDAVEFHPDGTIYPVEYKHGKRRRWINDDLQLAAQALCLEEMLERAVTRGAIYHQQSRRRREVIVDQALRREVEDTVEAVRGLLSKTERPPPVEDTRRCRECSLREICQPELARAEREIMGLKAHLFEPEDDEAV